jgi:hypothetical protein
MSYDHQEKLREYLRTLPKRPLTNDDYTNEGLSGEFLKGLFCAADPDNSDFIWVTDEHGNYIGCIQHGILGWAMG